MPKEIIELWPTNLCQDGRVCLSPFHLSCKGEDSNNTGDVFMMLKLKSTERETLGIESYKWFKKGSYLGFRSSVLHCIECHKLGGFGALTEYAYEVAEELNSLCIHIISFLL